MNDAILTPNRSIVESKSVQITREIHFQPVAGFVRPPNEQNGSLGPTYIWSGTYTVAPGKRDQVISILQEFGESVRQTEPYTWTYLVLKPTGDEDTLYLWERYANEGGLREVHVNSSAARGLKDKLGHLLVGRSMGRYHEMPF
jgi:quinol monooxygenase YgiN